MSTKDNFCCKIQSVGAVKGVLTMQAGLKYVENYQAINLLISFLNKEEPGNSKTDNKG